MNDCLLRVNNVDVSTMKYEKAVEAINEGDSVNIVSIVLVEIILKWCSCERPSKDHLFPIQCYYMEET